MGEHEKIIEPCSFITLGPTGSGKANWRAHLQKYFTQNLDDTVDILIDDIVENNDCYKQKVFNYFTEHVKLYNKIKETNLLLNSTLNKIVTEDFKKIIELEKIINDLNKFYFEVRKQINCDYKPSQFQNNPEKISKINMCQIDNTSGNIKSCDAKNDKKLLRALKKGQSVVIEMVGNKDFSWIFKDPLYSKYTTTRNWIVFIPIAPMNDLIERNKLRALKVLKSYIIKSPDTNKWKINTKQNPPRLPNVNRKIYLSTCKAIFNQLTPKKRRKYKKILIDAKNGGSINFIGFYNANTQIRSQYNIGHSPSLVSIDQLYNIFNESFDSSLSKFNNLSQLLQYKSIKKKQLNKRKTKRKKTTKPKRKIKRKKTTKIKNKSKNNKI